MKKGWLVLITGLVLALAVGLAGCSPTSATVGDVRGISVSNQQQGIWVTGEGKVTAVPDVAILRVGIEAQETTVAEARREAAEAMDSVMAALTSSGVAKNDIKTQYFSIQRVTKWDAGKNEEVVTGYRVSNMVTAKIRDIEKAGSIIDAVAGAGGDLTRIDNISFSIDDPSQYYDEARGKAVADAKAKAGQLAKLAGVTLGKPTYISEATYSPPIIYRDAAMVKEAAAPGVETPVSPGEIEISLSVQVVYDIR